jgi:aspartate racemase
MIIGVLGGMGSYATLHFFHKYLRIFSAEKEWDRPRIIIDNRCTMPSRVRAILYKEEYEQVVGEISESLRLLMNAGCDHIILACNTSHIFLEDVYRQVPEAESKVFHIIDNLAKKLLKHDEKSTIYSLIASEGTIQSGIYQTIFEKYGLSIQSPGNEVYGQLRYYIECVKKNEINEKVKSDFAEFIQELNCNNLILGCTEFPVLLDFIEDEMEDVNIYDPLENALQELRMKYDQI